MIHHEQRSLNLLEDFADSSLIASAVKSYHDKGYLQLSLLQLGFCSEELQKHNRTVRAASWEDAADPGDGYAGYRRYIPSEQENVSLNELVSDPMFIEIYTSIVSHSDYDVGGIAINILKEGNRVARHVDAVDQDKEIILSGIIYLEKDWVGQELRLEVKDQHKKVESLTIPPPSLVLLDPFVPHWQERIESGEKRSLIFALFGRK